MKKLLYTIIFILVVFIIAVAVINELKETPVAEPDVEGFVFSIDENSILVAEGLLEGEEYDGDTNNLQGSAFTFSLMDDTEVVNKDGEAVGVDELRVNQEVHVWHSGDVRESYPMQAEAVRIAITGMTSSQQLIKRDEFIFRCNTNTEEGRVEILSFIDDSWAELEREISVRPVQGSTGGSWTAPRHAQFIGNNRILIAFEDGHIMPMGVVEHECEDNTLIEISLVADGINQPDGFPFANEMLWMNMVKEYGNENHGANTYAKESIIDGEFLQFDSWREIDDNIFVR